MKTRNNSNIMKVAVIGGCIVAAVLILGTIWMGQSARRSTEEAVHSVSLFYLRELAGRREQVVASNLSNSIDDMQTAISLIEKEDLVSMQSLQTFQMRMRKLYELEKFAFVDTDGLIYTAEGTQTDIDQYSFDYQNLTQPEISIKNLQSNDKKVIIAVPVDHIPFLGQELIVSFMEIDMGRMLQGVSLQSDNNETTFANLYTRDGIALTNMILGGLASEDNLLDAMSHAVYDDGHSYAAVREEFSAGKEGVVSFTYSGIQETLYYEPVENTDWMLTYLIRESIIAEQFSSVSDDIIRRSLIQTVLTALVLLGLFWFMFAQSRRSAKLVLEKETAETASRVKQQELEQRLALQERLLEQEKTRAQQDSMITALASDYRSVYYVNLDNDEAICYRADPSDPDRYKTGDRFAFGRAFSEYAEHYVTDKYRQGFLDFIDPSNIRERLAKNLIITYRYLTEKDGRERYEMLRMAGVRHAEDRDDHIVHAIGVGFTDVDQEMRDDLAKNQVLSDALQAAEEANKAKTAFLSNMSHEIRTPMNAIIGLDNIALSDPDISDRTRDHLEKIESSAKHLLHLINDILDMSRIESGRMILKSEEFSFPRLLEQINTMISGQCSDKGLDYCCRINSPVDDYYIGDDMKLRQVLINILGNAVKFTPEGGSVTLDVEKTAGFGGRSTLQFTIRDTGIGMSSDYLPRIFDTFSQEDSSSTNRYGSSGLGLAITKSIVEMMNGKIEVESEKGKGSTFRVSVTLIDSDRKAVEGDDKEIHPQDLIVLVIDDDPIACEHARIVLEKVGISTEIALSGSEAVEKVRLRHARREPYNLILVDWKMPDMDGIETTRQIRAIVGNESAIIILTAYKWDDVHDEAMEAGVDSFIPKPLFASDVLEEVSQTVKRKNIIQKRELNRVDLKGRRVLLAEDVVINAEIMIMLLSMKEMEVDHAENGRVAVEKFETSEVGYYDAILMDMRMPEMDGLEATAAIRAMDRADAKQIPIVALTANAFDEDVQRSLQAGLNAHLSKPVEPEDLYETLESFIWERENR